MIVFHFIFVKKKELSLKFKYGYKIGCFPTEFSNARFTMKNRFNTSLLYLIAAVLLFGLGLYYFFFEPSEVSWWVMLLVGGLFNLYLAYQSRNSSQK